MNEEATGGAKMSKNAKKVISSIVERLKEKYKPEKIILYGSFAYGKPNRDSDIDILIIKSANCLLYTSDAADE